MLFPYGTELVGATSFTAADLSATWEGRLSERQLKDKELTALLKSVEQNRQRAVLSPHMTCSTSHYMCRKRETKDQYVSCPMKAESFFPLHTHSSQVRNARGLL